jgi:hypothetical protein
MSFITEFSYKNASENASNQLFSCLLNGCARIRGESCHIYDEGEVETRRQGDKETRRLGDWVTG